MNRRIKEIVILIVVLAWIPLGGLAFFVSEVRLDIKLLVAAGISFISLLIFWLKEE